MENLDDFTDDISEMLNRRTCIDETLTEDEERWLEAIESDNIDDILYEELKLIKDPKVYGVRQKPQKELQKQELPSPAPTQSNLEVLPDQTSKKYIVPPPIPELVPVSPSSANSTATCVKVSLSVSSNKAAEKVTAVPVSQPQLPKLLPLSQKLSSVSNASSISPKLLAKPLSKPPPSILRPVQTQLSATAASKKVSVVTNDRETVALLKRLEQKKLAQERKENIRKKTVERLLKKSSTEASVPTTITATVGCSDAAIASVSTTAVPSVSPSSCSRDHRQSIANLISGSNLNLVSFPVSISSAEPTTSDIVADCSTLECSVNDQVSTTSMTSVTSSILTSNNSLLTKNQTIKTTCASTRWIDTRTSTTVSFPKEFSLVIRKPQNAYAAPEIIFCSMNCGNPKRYACSKTLKPLCSLECYKKNVSLNPKMFADINSSGHFHRHNDVTIE